MAPRKPRTVKTAAEKEAPPPLGPMSEAVALLIADLRREGVWSSADEALAAVATVLARSLDNDAGMATAAVARELRATLTQLREAKPVDDDDDWISGLSAEVQHPPQP